MREQLQPLHDVPLATTVVAALGLAAARGDRQPLGTFDLLLAIVDTDSTGAWDAVQLHASYVALADAARFPDPDADCSGAWAGVSLTGTATRALATAARIAGEFSMLPLPGGVLALGLLADPASGASRALLAEAEIDHDALLEIVQDDVLDVHLEGLDLAAPRAVAEGASQPPAADEPRRLRQVQQERRDGPTAQRAGASPRPLGATLPAAAGGSERTTFEALLAGAIAIEEPDEPSRPLVLVRGEVLVEAYETARLGEVAVARIRRQLELARSLGETTGILPLRAVHERDGWLWAEFPYVGPRLSELLERRPGDGDARASPERQAAAFRDLARTLQTLHRRELVHGEIRPEELYVAADGRLWLSNRVQMLAGLGGGGAGTASSSGGRARRRNRYAAPELHTGERGPAVDQYALAAVARDVLSARGMPALPGPLRDVLRRATAPRPGQRYATVEAFGAALDEAMREEMPRTLADLLQALPGPIRVAWEPGAIALVLLAASQFKEVRAGHDLGGAVTGVVLTAFLIVLLSVFVSVLAWAGALIGDARRRFVLPFVYRRWVAPLATLLTTVALSATEPANVVGNMLGMLVVVYGARGVLAQPPPDAGTWLTGRVRRWERHDAGTARGRAIALAWVLGLVLLLAAPTLAGRTWPAAPVHYPITRYAATVTLWNFRAAIFRGDAATACALTRLEADPGRAPCGSLAGLATLAQRSDPITRRPAEAYGGIGDVRGFSLEPKPAPAGSALWSVIGPDGRHVGEMFTEGAGYGHLVVMLARNASYDDGGQLSPDWLYDVVEADGRWAIAGFRLCESAAPGSGEAARCLMTDHNSARRVAALTREIERLRARTGR